jgi:ribosome-associated protein
MSQEYVQKEVAKILENSDYAFPLNLAMASAWICGNLKGINLKVLDVTATSSLSDYFVLASASNSTQANAMAAEVSKLLKTAGHPVLSQEGGGASDWVLIDFGDIIVHIFLDYSRDVYDLDSLWKDAKIVQIPNDYYFSAPEGESEIKEDKGFF